MKRTNMNIFLNGLRIYARHGVMPQEQIVGAYYTIDLTIKTDFAEACEQDNLERTISYADILKCVKTEMNIPSQLLEHVANRICQRLMKEFEAIEEIDIRLSKENPPMGAECEACGVGMHCTRS